MLADITRLRRHRGIVTYSAAKKKSGENRTATHVFACGCGETEQGSRLNFGGKVEIEGRKLAKRPYGQEIMVYRSSYDARQNTITAASPPGSASRIRWCNAAAHLRTCPSRAGISRKCQTLSSTRGCLRRAGQIPPNSAPGARAPADSRMPDVLRPYRRYRWERCGTCRSLRRAPRLENSARAAARLARTSSN